MSDFTEPNWKLYVAYLRDYYTWLKEDGQSCLSFDEFMERKRKSELPPPPLTESQKTIKWMMLRDMIQDIDNSCERMRQTAREIDFSFSKVGIFNNSIDDITEKHIAELRKDRFDLVKMKMELR